MTVLAYLSERAYGREGIVGITVSGAIHLLQGRQGSWQSAVCESVLGRGTAFHILAARKQRDRAKSGTDL